MNYDMNSMISSERDNAAMRTRMRNSMRTRIIPLALLVGAGVACGNPLDVAPAGSLPEATAISDEGTAQSALAGAYSGLQSLSYYGEEFPAFTEVSSDNARNSGTYTSWADADQNKLTADNSTVADIWIAAYEDINRVNEIITRVPAIKDPNLGSTERNEIIGEAYFLRALNYHNLMKLWGDVPLRLQPTSSLSDAGKITRAPVSQVYTQILSDLDSAQALISDSSQTTQASAGAVQALRARVLLYKGDYAGAAAAATAVENMGYSLAPNYSDLFSKTGDATPEDIFRIIFTAQQYNNLSYDYLTRHLGGLYELAPATDLMHAYVPSWDPGSGSFSDFVAADTIDTRAQWNISKDGSRIYGSKYRSSGGTEHLHVIRFAEVKLIRAEALARTGDIADATTELNAVRARASLTPVATLSQAALVSAIIEERRRELAFEGDRWPDLVRLGLVATVLNAPATQALYPIPAREISVSPGLTQNPGY